MMSSLKLRWVQHHLAVILSKDRKSLEFDESVKTHCFCACNSLRKHMLYNLKFMLICYISSNLVSSELRGLLMSLPYLYGLLVFEHMCLTKGIENISMSGVHSKAWHLIFQSFGQSLSNLWPYGGNALPVSFPHQLLRDF